MEEDISPWAEDPHVQKPNETGKTALDYFSLTTDFASLPVCSAAVLADIFLIIVILRYRRLKTRTNLFLLNFAVFHAMYIVSTPFFYLVLDILFGGVLEVHWFCLWLRIENFAMALAISFGVGFGIDVVMEAKRLAWFHKYDERYIYVFSFFYFLHAMVYTITGTICFRIGIANNFHFYFLATYYLLGMIVLLYLGIQNRSTKLVANKEWVLNISIILSLCWLPLIFIYSLMFMFIDVHSVEKVLWYLAFLPEFLAYSASLVAVWQLWKYNTHFKMAFRKLLRRPVSLTDYEELFVSEDFVSN
ncbi:hypothetical protein JTB14_001004 [Gonioctena quinquepunctata]|nr:hypothetical protein JTB14_001004 [Gonioctena quinquepunctata]